MICKKAIKNAVIFTAMLLIVGINSTPLISKAGNSFGVAFSVDGETTFTDTQSKSTSSSVQILCTDKDHLCGCLVLIRILMVHIITAKYMLIKVDNIMMSHMAMNIISMLTKLIICLTG